jgi:hypothetical protein
MLLPEKGRFSTFNMVGKESRALKHVITINLHINYPLIIHSLGSAAWLVQELLMTNYMVSLYGNYMFKIGLPANPCVCLLIVIKKTGNTLFDVCSSCRASVLSGMVLVFKNKFLCQPHTTYHITSLLQTSKRKNIDCCHNLKNNDYSYPLE